MQSFFAIVDLFILWRACWFQNELFWQKVRVSDTKVTVRVYVPLVREIIKFQESIYDHALAQQPLLRGSWKIYHFGRSYLGRHPVIFSLSDLCPSVEKKIFTEIHPILHFFYPKIISLGVWGGGHKIHYFLSPYYTYATCVKLMYFLKNPLVYLQE